MPKIFFKSVIFCSSTPSSLLIDSSALAFSESSNSILISLDAATGKIIS